MNPNCCCQTSEQPCGCCEGIEKITPQTIANRPGLQALSYRVGTHATFFESMLARISELVLDVRDASGGGDSHSLMPLESLRTRDQDDPAIAWLDSWATVADVLTFYQERIANEGFLRTAIERRSILELARLVGYKLRPGVAATVYLAFEMEKDQSSEIPQGIRAQSIPGPGEMPQAFETSHPLEARFLWNALKPRLTRPQWITTTSAPFLDTIYFEGIATNLKPNDTLLLVFEGTALPKSHFVQTVEQEASQDRTKVTTRFSVTPLIDAIRDVITAFLRDIINASVNVILIGFRNELLQDPLPKPLDKLLADTISKLGGLLPGLQSGDLKTQKEGVENLIISFYRILIRIPPDVTVNPAFATLRGLVEPLLRAPSLQPQNPFRRSVSVARSFSSQSDIGPQLLVTQRPELQEALYDAWRRAQITPSTPLKSVEVLRTKAAPFGNNAPPKFLCGTDDQGNCVVKGTVTDGTDWDLVFEDPPDSSDTSSRLKVLSLDGIYDEIKRGSWVVIQRPTGSPISGTIYRRVDDIQTVTRVAYSLSTKVTRLILNEAWLNDSDTMRVVRNTTVNLQSEPLELAEEPVAETVEGDLVELDGLYDGLKSGRWLVVSGERTDLTQGSQSDEVRASELVMLTAATQGPHQFRLPDGTALELPGDTPHTTLRFANALAYKYKRDTVTINANVAHATNGETRNHVLGSGDGAKGFQEFKLSHSPLTFVSATTSSGIESTLEVRVNDVLWRESPQLSELGPNDRRYLTRRDNEGNTFVVFGNGVRGARLPTGIENVKALYRNGIGKAANVAAKQISLLATRPSGVKGVLNPQPATGGADAEDANSGRQNATVALKALDRAVSVPDYADFAAAFAGIGKASARRLSDGRRELVHLTIAGANDIPIVKNSDLYRNLQQALFRYGDPHQALQIEVRELLLIIISAKVKIFPEHLWEVVEPRLRATLLETFGFDNREIGQDVLRSEIISVMEAVEGVDYIDVDRLDALSQDRIVQNLENLDNVIRATGDDELKNRVTVEFARLDRSQSDPDQRIRPAQLAYLSPAVPDTLILTEITS